MKIFLQLASCFLALLAATLADSSSMTFKEFKEGGETSMNISCKILQDVALPTERNEQEEKYRMNLFMHRRALIDQHNARYENGSVTYKMGINKFSDMTVDEFASTYTGLKLEIPHKRTGEIVNFPNMDVPDQVNWLNKGAVTPVKDQGLCGSCYAFSATGSMEGQHFRNTGKLVSLSEQNIIDCSESFGNFGCAGGLMDNVFEYVISNKGIDTEASYPYNDNGYEWLCSFSNMTIGATFTKYKDLPSGDEKALEKAVATIGPISVAVDASDFMSYDSGIYSNSECSAVLLDHGVLVVGYGTDYIAQQRYWLVKNSWGAGWGENGYIRIAKNANNMCGIATLASYPVV